MPNDGDDLDEETIHFCREDALESVCDLSEVVRILSAIRGGKPGGEV